MKRRRTAPPRDAGDPAPPATGARLVRRHLRFGWWWLALFVSLGLVLEGLHGFKVAWYLDVANDTRRLLWTLTHAHGTLLALINVVFAASLGALQTTPGGGLAAASRCLVLASILLPGGFFLGGLTVYEGDPGLGILLVPVGGILLLCAVVLTALNVVRGTAGS